MSARNTRYQYILDTDIVTYQQLGREEVLRYLAQLEAGTIATTIITAAEQLQGRLAFVRRQRNANALTEAHRYLQMTQQYFCRMPVLPFDTASVAIYKSLWSSVCESAPMIYALRRSRSHTTRVW